MGQNNPVEKPAMLEGGVDASQLEAWKKKHGELFLIHVKAESRKLTGYFRQPSAIAVEDAIGEINKSRGKACKILLIDCFLGGDMEFLENESVAHASFRHLLPLIHIYESELVKL